MIKHYRADYGALSCPVVCRVTGPLDLVALRRAVTDLSARHESMRTTFHGRGARLSQRVNPPRDEPVELIDVSVADDPRAAADRALAAELREPVDPTRWPTRARLWRTGPEEHLFCLNLHHLVTDAWSTGILLRDLCLLYDRASGGHVTLPPVGWPPARFAEWQRTLLTGEPMRRHQEYWRRQLAGARLPDLTAADPPGTAGEPSGPASETASGTEGAVDTVDLPGRVVAGLQALARRERTTMFTVLLALLHAELYRTTGQRDLSVASMFANRNRPELRETVGLLAGMVVLRARVEPEHGFGELLRRCHGAVLGAFTYSELPFQLLPTDLVDTGGGRADDVMFNVMTRTEHLRTAAGVGFELVVPTDIGSRFPFELVVVPIGAARMRVALFRAPDRLRAAGGARFLDGYATLAGAVAETPDATLQHLLTIGAHA